MNHNPTLSLAETLSGWWHQLRDERVLHVGRLVVMSGATLARELQNAIDTGRRQGRNRTAAPQ